VTIETVFFIIIFSLPPLTIASAIYQGMKDIEEWEKKKLEERL
jgi:hypothetical protein